jgi:hypothetical protein
MSGKDIHKWNVMIVKNHDFPRPVSKEFQVKSATLLGAGMKASRIIKNKYLDWVIQSIWWLDPKRVMRNLK